MAPVHDPKTVCLTPSPNISSNFFATNKKSCKIICPKETIFLNYLSKSHCQKGPLLLRLVNLNEEIE